MAQPVIFLIRIYNRSRALCQNWHKEPLSFSNWECESSGNISQEFFQVILTTEQYLSRNQNTPGFTRYKNGDGINCVSLFSTMGAVSRRMGSSRRHSQLTGVFHLTIVIWKGANARLTPSSSGLYRSMTLPHPPGSRSKTPPSFWISCFLASGSHRGSSAEMSRAYRSCRRKARFYRRPE